MGAARQTAVTIFPALVGAPAAAALAMAPACLGCAAAAVPAAADAISGVVLAIAPTMAGAAAGLMPTAALTTLIVAVCRWLALVSLTTWAALAGSSMGGTPLKVSLKGLETSPAKEFRVPNPTKVLTIAAINLIFFLLFIMTSGQAQTRHCVPNRSPASRQFFCAARR